MPNINDLEKTISQKDKKLSSQFKTEVPNEVIEEQTKKIPNLVFLAGALGSMALSALLASRKKTVAGNFVGLWVPTILTFGVYNKLVKVEDEILKMNERSLH